MKARRLSYDLTGDGTSPAPPMTPEGAAVHALWSIGVELFRAEQIARTLAVAGDLPETLPEISWRGWDGRRHSTPARWMRGPTATHPLDYPTRGPRAMYHYAATFLSEGRPLSAVLYFLVTRCVSERFKHWVIFSRERDR